MDNTSPRLLDQLRSACRLRHFSRRTEEAYCHWTRRFIVFHGKRHPSALAGPEVTQFLASLANDHRVGASTQNQALCALLFLYRIVLKCPLPDNLEVPRVRTPPRLPVVLTRTEVRAVMAQLHGVPHLVASLLYGAGLLPTGACRRSGTWRTWRGCSAPTTARRRSASSGRATSSPRIVSC